MEKRPSVQEMQQQCTEFNKNHPVGSIVRAWTGIVEGPGQTGEVKYQAEVLSGHTPVVWVSGIRGCIALTHVEGVL